MEDHKSNGNIFSRRAGPRLFGSKRNSGAWYRSVGTRKIWRARRKGLVVVGAAKEGSR